MPESLLNDLSDHSFPTSPFDHPNANVWAFERLNHADPSELLDHAPVLPEQSRWRLETGLNKISAYRERFDRPADHYRPLLALVATSNWNEATPFSLCGVQNNGGRRGRAVRSVPCRQWKLCPACSYWQRKRAALAAYLTRFHRTSWFLVTVSYQASFGEGIFDEEAVRLCWKAAQAGLYGLQHAGGIRGAVTRNEMHLEQFLPLTYHPHIHAVVDADQIDQPLLAESVFAYRCPDTGSRVTFPISVKHRRLDSERAFANALSYLGKSLNIALPYLEAWPRAATHNRRLAPKINAEVDEFLESLEAFTADTHQVRYTGTCHPAFRHTLRVPRAERASERDLVAAILTENNLQGWEKGDGEPAMIFPPPPR